MGSTDSRNLAILLTLILSLGVMVPTGSRAFTPTVTPKGIQVHWKGDVKLELAGNPTNSVGISDSDFFSAVVHGLQRWNQVSGGSIRFDYWQGTDPVVYVPNSDFNGLSSIYFASNSKNPPGLTPNVLGLTQVWYDTHSGQILETDIVLNDKDFHFTTQEQDTSGYGSGSTPSFGSKSHVFIENVITHELGHALGLSHSGGLQSTMLFMESPEQAHLGCDEQIAIHAIYPSEDGNKRGAIVGTVQNEAGAPIFGAQVLAISRRRGTVLATAMTDKSGNYKIAALEPGAYYLMFEPFFAGSAPLPVFYSDINTTFCPGDRPFGRALLTDSSGYLLQDIQVSPGQDSAAPKLVGHCNHESGASIAAIPSSSLQSSAPVIFDGSRESGGFGATDKLGTSGGSYYKLHTLSGRVEIHAMAYSLYSPIHAVVDLVDSSGTSVATHLVDPAYRGESGFVNYDTSLVAENLAPGDYFIRVTSSPLDASLYPAGPVSLDSQPFLVITGSVNEGEPALAGSVPVNARCRNSENFASYSSPPGPPPRHSTSGDVDSTGVGFCGSVDSQSSQSSQSFKTGDRSGGASYSAIVGWFAPWVFMLVMAQILARAARWSGPQGLAKQARGR